MTNALLVNCSIVQLFQKVLCLYCPQEPGQIDSPICRFMVRNKVSYCGRSTFAVDGKDCKVNTEVERVLKDFHKAGKPIGYVCWSDRGICLHVETKCVLQLTCVALMLELEKKQLFCFISCSLFLKCFFFKVCVCVGVCERRH